jgi:CRISPR/Cas system CSM-associated protein Csm3 (group 7 of RAMP superfamily)
MLSLESRLRSMEDVKEHSHGEASKRIDERREQQYRRNHAPQEIEDGEHERPHQKSRYHNCPDQCQQCRIFECHGRSMNVASVIRNPDWRVVIVGSQANNRWEMRIFGPKAFERSYTLEGTAGEHDPQRIATLVARLVPGRKPLAGC